MVRDSAVHTDGTVLRLGNLEWTNPSSPQRLARRRHRRRLLRVRRFIGSAMAIGLLCGITLGALFLISPGVANAPGLARQLDSAHHAGYPGPAVPPRLVAALVASQDRGFYSEAGPVRAAQEVVGQLIRSSGRSAPSLSLRLASILYIHGRSGLAAAVEQALVSVKFDISYSRAQIIQMYAAVTNFGHGYYGLAAASCGYFARPPDRLSWAQAAMLAALSAAPSAADPMTHPARARAAEAVVLHRLAAAGVLNRTVVARAYGQPLRLAQRGAGSPECP
jgi:membrane peptidoglycan carboxypeptidase